MNKLIYGKANLDRIVGIEIVDDKAEVFLQDEFGEISTQLINNEYWILSNRPHDENWKKLKGNQYYGYGRKYTDVREFYDAKRDLRKAEADIYVINDPKEAFMVKNGYTYFRGLKQPEVSVLSFDIESTSLEMNDSAKVLLISNTFRKNGVITKKLFAYDDYETDGDMLVAWCKWVRDMDPSIILGHNILGYDLPYIQYIADREGVELSLGRNESPLSFAKFESQKRIDGSRDQAYRKVKIYGREVIDTMFLAINYDIGKKYESYGLKKIIAHEKLEKENRTFYDASQIRFNYTKPEEWQKIKDYCADDSDDALALYDLMSPMFFYLTQSVPKSFQAVTESASGSQINSMMVRSYLQDGFSIPKTSPPVAFEGAISFGNPGVYNYAFKVDVGSLYPNTMLTYGIFDKYKDPNGNMLKILEIFTAERLRNKKLAKDTGIKHYDDLQNSQKIIVNSVYGFLGAEGLCFNSPRNAALVTKYGREVLTNSLVWAERKGFTIINADTDSITITNNTELSEDQRKGLLEDLNSEYPERIRFEDDGYYKRLIVLRAKNYILWDGNKIKIKGSALKDAKKEKALKEFLLKVIEAMINDTNGYVDIYNAYVKEASSITDISRWASKKTISNKVLTNERPNEAKIRDAIQGEEIVEGDKVYMYYKPDGSLGLANKFDGEYDKVKLYEKIYKTAMTFENVIPKETFVNYKLKRNQEKLKELIGETK